MMIRVLLGENLCSCLCALPLCQVTWIGTSMWLHVSELISLIHMTIYIPFCRGGDQGL